MSIWRLGSVPAGEEVVPGWVSGSAASFPRLDVCRHRHRLEAVNNYKWCIIAVVLFCPCAMSDLLVAIQEWWIEWIIKYNIIYNIKYWWSDIWVLWLTLFHMWHLPLCVTAGVTVLLSGRAVGRRVPTTLGIYTWKIYRNKENIYIDDISLIQIT